MPTIIDVYAAPADKFFVNSFIIAGDEALVLVDVQFLVSTANAVADIIAARDKPLAGILITHPHPDHFNGLPIFLDRFGPLPVYANQATIDGMAATQGQKRAAWKPVFGDDYPAVDALPDRVIGFDQTLAIGGIAIRSLDLGPGESADISVLHVESADALIVSDLVYHRAHPWLAEQRSDLWLNQLARVEEIFPSARNIYPGHGPAGGRELFEAQRRYIVDFRNAVAQHSRQGKLDAAGLAEVRARALAGREGWALESLIDMNAAAVAAELAGSRA